MAEEEEIQDQKMYYAIGEVSKMLGLSVSHIRFWEQQFEVIKPRKNRRGDRFFTPQDIEMLKMVQHLVKDKGYTLEGARKKLLQNKDEISQRMAMLEQLKKVRGFLVTLRDQLEK